MSDVCLEGRKMSHQSRTYLFSLLIIITILFTDQLIKVKSILSYHYYLNPNTFLGLLKSNTLGIILLSILTILIIYLAIRQPNKSILFAVIAAGLFSNIIDRLSHHGVIDYWRFSGALWFNLADIAIVVGLCFWLYSQIQTKKTVQ